MRLRISFLAVLLATLAAPLPLQAQDRLQRAHERAKEAATGFVSGLLSDLVSESTAQQNMPAGSYTAPPTGDPAYPNESTGETELALVACYLQVAGGALSEAQLEQDCQVVLKPIGASPGSTSGSSQLVISICQELVRTGQAPETRLGKHCGNVLAAQEMAARQIEQREAAREGAQLSVSDDPRYRPTITENEIENSYSGCTEQTEEVAPEMRDEETCEVSRVATRNNACTKRLEVEVDWRCPAGAISGPTRVRAGTAQAAGRYTCEVELQREVHACPGGWEGPLTLPIPPSGQSGPACRNASGDVRAADRSTVTEVVTRDASHHVTERWDGDCGELEAATPADWRTTLFGASVGPMVAFDPSPNQLRCRLASGSCTDASILPRVIEDVPVQRACWQYAASYDCRTTTTSATCEEDPQCQVIEDRCVETDPYSQPPSCLRREVRRSCVAGPATSRTVTNCAGQTYCPNGRCWDTGYEPDRDFGIVMAFMESGRQAGRYLSANDLEIFKGWPARCRHTSGGLFNCCRKNKFRDFLFGTLNVAENLKHSSSKDENNKSMFSDKTWDVLYAAESSGTVAAGLRSVEAMKGEAEAIWSDLKDQDYKGAVKRVFVTTPKRIVEAGADAIKDAITESLTLHGLIAVCEEDEQVTIKKRANHLCVDVGSRCTQEVPLTNWCWERTYRFCCFNSLLAKLINQQGREQIRSDHPELGENLFDGGDNLYGTARTPNCRGFNEAQLRALDFSRIDLTPFFASLDFDLEDKDGNGVPDLKDAAVENAMDILGVGSDCRGGAAQCDRPEASPDQMDETAVAAGVQRQYLSLRPLMMQAFQNGAAEGEINNEDVRLLSKWRFRGAEAPLRARVEVLGPHSRPDCRLMGVTLTREPLTVTWQDEQALREGQPADRTQTWPGMERRSMVSFCSDGSLPGAAL